MKQVLIVILNPKVIKKITATAITRVYLQAIKLKRMITKVDYKK